jgi:hypothetical protein
MPAYKDETRGTWYTQFYYMDDKVKKHKVKRGFRTKGEAEEFEISFKARNMETKDMKFSDYYLCQVFGHKISRYLCRHRSALVV